MKRLLTNSLMAIAITALVVFVGFHAWRLFTLIAEVF